MIISVINHTKGKITDEQLQVAIRAINRQIAHDFEPYWSLSAELRLEGRGTSKPTTHTIADMRGDAVLYVWDELDVDDGRDITTETTEAFRTVLCSWNWREN